MKKIYRNVRIILFAILMLTYYIMFIFVNDINLKWIELLLLIFNICLGIAILLLDIRKMSTNKKKIIAFLLLLVLAISLDLIIERYFLSFNLAIKLIAILAFIIIYALFLNYDIFSIEYK